MKTSDLPDVKSLKAKPDEPRLTAIVRRVLTVVCKKLGVASLQTTKEAFVFPRVVALLGG